MLGNRRTPVSVDRVDGQRLEHTRLRAHSIRLAAREMGIAPVAVAGLLLLAGDVLRRQDHPEAVREIQALIGAEVGDHAATVAAAERFIGQVFGERPRTVA